MALISRTGMLLAIIAVLAAPANGQQYDRSVAAGRRESSTQNAPAYAEERTQIPPSGAGLFILDAPSPGRRVRETPRAAADLRYPYACCPSG